MALSDELKEWLANITEATNGSVERTGRSSHGCARELSVEMWYPRVHEQRTGNVSTVYIDLIDVRASDGIFIRYDFERDGWVIMQEPGKEGDDFGEDTGPPQEVAFVQSWSLVEKAPGSKQ